MAVLMAGKASDWIRGRSTPVLLIVFALMICLRMPRVVISGRFWAEEGKIFFHNAWVLPPTQALFFSFAGYLNLAANAATLAARWLMPLPIAPYFTICVSLAVQLFPVLLILSARDAWLKPLRMKLAGVLLIILVPGAEEVWLDTIHCQFELALCSAMILTLDLVGGPQGTFRLCLLFIAPLCGPVVIALLPAFLIRAILERSRVRLLQAASLGAGTAIQLFFFFHILAGRGSTINVVTLLCVITVRHIALPFLGVSQANFVSQKLHAIRAAGHLPLLALIVPAVVFLPFGLTTVRRGLRDATLWFLISCVSVALLSYLGALGGLEALFSDVRGGGRYTFVPQALLSLALLAFAVRSKSWIATVSWLGVIWLMTIGALEYTQPFSLISDGPSWRQQVAAWRIDPSYSIQLWPTGWSMTLDKVAWRPGKLSTL